jgi:hypothetical protein
MLKKKQNWKHCVYFVDQQGREFCSEKGRKYRNFKNPSHNIMEKAKLWYCNIETSPYIHFVVKGKTMKLLRMLTRVLDISSRVEVSTVLQ